MPLLDSVRVVSIESRDLLVGVMPERGAKVCSLMDKRTGREWLLPSQLPGGRYPAAELGADFSRFDTSGFDECFPVVGEGPHPDASIHWPDHGELWSRPWLVERQRHGLLTRIEGHGWPYTFTRLATLEQDSLRLDYRLDNHADRDFCHLWSAHPLLSVRAGMRLLLPDSFREASVTWASNPLLGRAGERRPWPELLPGRDFSTVLPPESGLAVKLHFPFVGTGWCGLLEPVSGQALTLTWDPKQLPHLGLWLCYGGWPTDGRVGHQCVALEPCSGMPDDLQEAAKSGTCCLLEPGRRREWSLRIRSHLAWMPQQGALA